ncbi:hypothetical protein HAX54_015270 [Datura stramonium]|uniref:phosphoethanolamine N-methyltransferase n=1 Tax=Datura stramonium TaxID=4076 RepID=A0ABS8S014_DATST|nr:hypothetical protein [Datura stramonium]
MAAIAAPEVGQQEREIQKSYWNDQTAALNLEAITLDSEASDLDKEDRSGGALAEKAGELVAVDFIEGVIKKNESINGHHKNVKFMFADVTSPDLTFLPESVDLIFSNWLLMYLSDEEEQKTKMRYDHHHRHRLSKMQWWIQHFVDYQPVSSSMAAARQRTSFNYVCEPEAREKVLLDVGCGIGGGDFYMAEKYGVHVVGIDLSVNMISLAFERAIGLKCAVEFEVADCTVKTYPEGTFDVIYSRDTILHIQDKPALFRSFYKWLKPGGRVLISDYCKKAGPASEEFAGYIKQRGYDLHDVEAYGQCFSNDSATLQFHNIDAQRCRFQRVIAEDRTEQFMKVLRKELDTVEKERVSFIQEFSEQDYNDIVGGWKAKLIRSSSGEQRWGLFFAKKI